MNGALLLAASVGVSSLGYSGLTPGAGADFELHSRSDRTQLVASARYLAAKKQDVGGYALTGSLALRRFFGNFEAELGGEVVDQRTNEWTKRAVHPWIGAGYRHNDWLTVLRVHGADNTENELRGVSVRVEGTDGRWRPYGSIGFWKGLDHQGQDLSGMTCAFGVALRVSGR